MLYQVKIRYLHHPPREDSDGIFASREDAETRAEFRRRLFEPEDPVEIVVVEVDGS